MKIYRKPIYSLVLIAILSFAVWYVGSISELLHIFVNVFAGGRSTVKAWAFFSYLLAISLLCIYKGSKPISSPWLTRAVITATVTLYISGLAIFLFILFKIRANLFGDYIFFSGSELSSSTLTHNHVLKGIVGAIAQSLNQTQAENIDIGIPFLQFVHPVIYLCAGLLFLFTSLGFWLLATRQYSKHPTYPWLYIILYTVSSFSVIKNVLDGGILNSEAIASGALVILLIYNIRHKAVQILFMAGVSSAVIGVILIALNPYHDTNTMVRYITQTLGLTTLYSTGLYWLVNPRVARLHWLLCVLSGLILIPLIGRDLSILHYEKTRLSPQDTAYVSSYKPITNPSYELATKVGQLSIYKFTSPNTTNFQQIITEHHLLSNLVPVLTTWQQCFPTGKPSKYTFELLSKQTLTQTDQYQSGIKISSVNTSVVHDWLVYNISVTIPACYPRPLNIIHETLKQTGQDTFILTNMETPVYD